MTGLAAFKDGFLSGNVLDGKDFSDFDARRMRYEMMWALYENSIYRDVHKWAVAYKAEYGLYKFIRTIYNPAYRIGEFWKSHLFGGQLDPDAGDGGKIISAIPITTKNEQLRPALAELWRSSNWQLQKDIMALWGSTLGDAVIKIIDDPEKEKVSLRVVHPGTLRSVTLDPWGNVKGYIIEEVRYSEKGNKKAQTYREVATRDGDAVVYKTFLDDKPFSDIEGEPAEWAEPYGFIPMVKVQHNNVGLDWGWSELFPDLGKFREADDLASKLSDQIRKMVSAPWLFSGVDDPKKNITVPGTPRTSTTGATVQTGREEVPALYAGLGAQATPLIANFSISETSSYIESILKDIEKDYPELAVSLQNVQGDISGRALRINQQPVVEKVLQRRANYDDAIVRAQQMAVAIGGHRGYKGYEGFNLDSYKSGALDHKIGARPVFGRDPMDDLEVEEKLWSVAVSAKAAGMPLDMYLIRRGWSEDEVKKLIESAEYKAKLAALENLANAGPTEKPDALKSRFNANPDDLKKGEKKDDKEEAKE